MANVYILYILGYLKLRIYTLNKHLVVVNPLRKEYLYLKMQLITLLC